MTRRAEMSCTSQKPLKEMSVGALPDFLIVEGMRLFSKNRPRNRFGAGEGEQPSERLLERKLDPTVDHTECFDDGFRGGSRNIALSFWLLIEMPVKILKQ